ncbi:MAG: hypothetical protein LBS96_09375 [Oscillospiraceae bacterium]|jgi:hypothetical protein|nr:hypothetical protein [Oscillospiraceae bacterium]
MFPTKSREQVLYNVSFRFVEDGSPGSSFFRMPVTAGSDCIGYPADSRPPREGWDFICFSPPSLHQVVRDEVVDVHYTKKQNYEHTVYFLDYSGKSICPPRKVLHGEALAPPSVAAGEDDAPAEGTPCYRVPEGRRFIGWSRSTARVLDDTFCVALTEDAPPAPEPEKPVYSITFCDECGFPLETAPRMVKEGCAVIPPLYAPRKGDGWRHTGWNVPLGCVTQDMVVRATVAQKEYPVRFLGENGDVLGSVTVRHGEAAPLPQQLPPLPEGCIARRWKGELQFVTEARVILEELERETYFAAFYDNDGLELDEVIIPYGGQVDFPEYDAPEGWNFLGWKAVTEEGNEFLPAGRGGLVDVTGDCKIFAQCEPSVCRVQVLDLRNPAKLGLFPMGGWSYGVVLSQADLACMHLRHENTLPPFHFPVKGDTLLVLTEQTVKVFDMAMQQQPTASVNLLPGMAPKEVQAEATAQDARRREA